MVVGDYFFVKIGDFEGIGRLGKLYRLKLFISSPSNTHFKPKTLSFRHNLLVL
jgi:hypothetical protein